MGDPARVLVADDEKPLRRLLRMYLEKEGFVVVEAEDGLEALSRVRAGAVEIALVDVMLPELDGFEVVRRIRRESAIPVILITARGEEANRVAGLELGADDYVVKPFSAPEVVARVRAQLRRMRGFTPADTVLRTGGIELNRLERTCLAHGDPVELTRREFDLLATLLSQPGRVHTRDQLLEAAWGTAFLSEKTVDVHVASLRRKLGDAIDISALRGVGYRLERS